MEITLYLFDPNTGIPTDKVRNVEYSGTTDLRALSVNEVWKELGLKLPVSGSLYAPPQGYVFDGHGWAPPPSVDEMAHSLMYGGNISIDYMAISGKVAAIVNAVERMLADVPTPSTYTEEERSSWPAQLEEARAVLSGDYEGKIPILSGIAEAEGRDLEELALSVVDKAEKYAAEQAARVVALNLRRKQLAELRELLRNSKSYVRLLTELKNLK